MDIPISQLLDISQQGLLQGLEGACAQADARLQALQGLATADAPTAVWSSQVLAAQSKVSDALEAVRTFMFDLEACIEEAEGCVPCRL